MQRQPLSRKQAPTQQISRIASFAAPVGGWNARDALAAMAPGDAVRLINWYPRTTECVIRGGQEDYASGMASSLRTLAVRNAMGGTAKMFAADNSGIYDVSSAGAVGASVATSTNGYWQSVNFGDGTNHWLIMVNGTDKPNYYNGSAWTAVDSGTTPALTGITTTDLIGVFTHKGRLCFIKKNSLSWAYLAAGAAGGALTEFRLDQFCKRGGYLMAAGSWSVESGDGPDDRCAFVTSEGEVLVYQGTDPSDATKWALVGVYYFGKPLGRRCLLKFGGDLVLITSNGAIPLSALMQSTVVDRRQAITNKIETAFATVAGLYGSELGWEAIYYPPESAILFNIPSTASTGVEQFVFNASSPRKPWCQFQGWDDATCFALYGGELYYGNSAGEVRKAWTGKSDDGVDIVADAKEAFQTFGVANQKRANLYRPILRVNGAISYLTGIDIDFKDTGIVGTASYNVTAGATWDVAQWDVAYWAASLDVVRQWSSPQENLGTWFAGKLKIATNALTVEWLASDMMFEQGSGI